MQIFQDNEDFRRVPILLAGANCTGDETSLADCPGNGLNVDTVQCGLRDIVTLLCYSNLDPGVHQPLSLNGSRFRKVAYAEPAQSRVFATCDYKQAYLLSIM